MVETYTEAVMVKHKRYIVMRFETSPHKTAIVKYRRYKSSAFRNLV